MLLGLRSRQVDGGHVGMSVLTLWGVLLLASGCSVFRGGDETTDSGAEGCRGCPCALEDSCDSGLTCVEGSCRATSDGAAGSGGGGTGGSAASKTCTTEEEDALIGDGPFTDACPTVLNGPRTAPARNAVYPGDPDSVRVSFDQGALTTFEGAACRAASSGAKTSEFGSCRQYYVCGCCGIQLERSG